MNFAKFLRAPFFTEHVRWLLLKHKKSYLQISISLHLLHSAFQFQSSKYSPIRSLERKKIKGKRSNIIWKRKLLSFHLLSYQLYHFNSFFVLQLLTLIISKELGLTSRYVLRKMCPYSELFWSAFSHI